MDLKTEEVIRGGNLHDKGDSIIGQGQQCQDQCLAETVRQSAGAGRAVTAEGINVDVGAAGDRDLGWSALTQAGKTPTALDASQPLIVPGNVSRQEAGPHEVHNVSAAAEDVVMVDHIEDVQGMGLLKRKRDEDTMTKQELAALYLEEEARQNELGLKANQVSKRSKCDTAKISGGVQVLSSEIRGKEWSGKRGESGAVSRVPVLKLKRLPNAGDKWQLASSTAYDDLLSSVTTSGEASKRFLKEGQADASLTKCQGHEGQDTFTGQEVLRARKPTSRRVSVNNVGHEHANRHTGQSGDYAPSRLISSPREGFDRDRITSPRSKRRHSHGFNPSRYRSAADGSDWPAPLLESHRGPAAAVEARDSEPLEAPIIKLDHSKKYKGSAVGTVEGQMLKHNSYDRKKQRQADKSDDDWNSSRVEMSASPGSATCHAHVLVVQGDRGWRERDATIDLRSEREQWVLAITTKEKVAYVHRADQAGASGTMNRHTNSMIWRGDKAWSLEFESRKEWLKFKAMHEECVRRNARSLNAKHIPIPGTSVVSDYLTRFHGPKFARPVDHYIQQYATEGQMALSHQGVLYEMDSDDEAWLERISGTELGGGAEGGQAGARAAVSAEEFERVMDTLEKEAFRLQAPSVSAESTLELCQKECGDRATVLLIHSHWLEKRERRGMALVRQFQPAPWEQYQSQIQSWQAQLQQVRESNAYMSAQQVQQQVKRPPVFAFCLRPRSSGEREKLRRHRSQRRQVYADDVEGGSAAVQAAPGELASQLAAGGGVLRSGAEAEVGKVHQRRQSEPPPVKAAGQQLSNVPEKKKKKKMKKKFASLTGVKARNGRVRKAAHVPTATDLAGAFWAVAQGRSRVERPRRSRPNVSSPMGGLESESGQPSPDSLPKDLERSEARGKGHLAPTKGSGQETRGGSLGIRHSVIVKPSRMPPRGVSRSGRGAHLPSHVQAGAHPDVLHVGDADAPIRNEDVRGALSEPGLGSMAPLPAILPPPGAVGAAPEGVQLAPPPGGHVAPPARPAKVHSHKKGARKKVKGEGNRARPKAALSGEAAPKQHGNRRGLRHHLKVLDPHYEDRGGVSHNNDVVARADLMNRLYGWTPPVAGGVLETTQSPSARTPGGIRRRLRDVAGAALGIRIGAEEAKWAPGGRPRPTVREEEARPEGQGSDLCLVARPGGEEAAVGPDGLLAAAQEKREVATAKRAKAVELYWRADVAMQQAMAALIVVEAVDEAERAAEGALAAQLAPLTAVSERVKEKAPKKQKAPREKPPRPAALPSSGVAPLLKGRKKKKKKLTMKGKAKGKKGVPKGGAPAAMEPGKGKGLFGLPRPSDVTATQCPDVINLDDEHPGSPGDSVKAIEGTREGASQSTDRVKVPGRPKRRRERAGTSEFPRVSTRKSSRILEKSLSVDDKKAAAAPQDDVSNTPVPSSVCEGQEVAAAAKEESEVTFVSASQTLPPVASNSPVSLSEAPGTAPLAHQSKSAPNSEVDLTVGRGDEAGALALKRVSVEPT
eukprot:jgi/Mesen1/8739/ME000052S08169